MSHWPDFYGQFDLNRPLTPAHQTYLRAFNKTHRCKRDPVFVAGLSDPCREAVGLPVGHDGEYYVGDVIRNPNEEYDVAQENYNTPPGQQPGTCCKWVPTYDGKAIRWDGSVGFHHYIEWLKYLIQHFFIPWGYVLNGKVRWNSQCCWHDDDSYNEGIIEVTNNVVQVGHYVKLLTYDN